MTTATPLSPITVLQWDAIGAWRGGTALAVALATTGNQTHGLLASRAGVYGWTQPGAAVTPLPHGLNDLNIVTIAITPGEGAPLAFAATATGRLFSRAVDDEAAVEWQEIGGWAGLGVAMALAVSPNYASDQTLFVGTPTGIFRTQDGGQSWESCNFGLLDEDILSLTCTPNFGESEVLFAGTAGGGFYRSRNSGRAWRDSGVGLPDAAVQSITVSPTFAEDRTLYVGMEGHGVYVSRDGGENWTPLALGNLSVNALACGQAEWLWAGTEDGLWRIATVRGAAEQVTGAGEAVLSVATTATGQVAAALFGGGLCLTDDGRGAVAQLVWQRPSVVLHAPPVVAAVGGELFALDSDGLVGRTQDGGETWSELAGASLDGVFALDGALVGPEGETNLALFAATGTGVSRWSNADETWQEVASAPFTERTALGVEVSPAFATDQTLVVATQDSALLLSQDGGLTWGEITGPWSGHTLLRARFAPESPTELVALSAQPNAAGHFSVAVWHTIDLGVTWEVLAGLTSGVPALIMAWPADTNERAIFLATQHRVIKLYNQVDPPTLQVHQHFFDESFRVTALAAAPDFAESGTIWAASSGGIYRSVDRGMSWGLMLELPLGLPVVWLDVTTTQLNAITLGGHTWRATL